MEVPQTIKSEKVDCFAREPDVSFERNILDSIAIKLEPVKVEPDPYVPELVQKFDSMEEAKVIRLNEISKQKCSEIELKGSEEIDKVEDIVDVKWEIENKELNSKNIEETEQSIFQKQGQHQNKNCNVGEFKSDKCEYVAGGEDNFKEHLMKNKNHRKFKCDQCEYATMYKSDLKKHLLKHTKPEEVSRFKCDQCDFTTVYKNSIKYHILKHTNPKEVSRFKCDHCEYATVHKKNLKIHLLIHTNLKTISKHKCVQCEYVTVYKSNLKRHNIINHQDPEEITRCICDQRSQIFKNKNPEEDRMLRCDQCNYATVLERSFKKHRIKHKNSEEISKLKCDQ